MMTRFPVECNYNLFNRVSQYLSRRLVLPIRSDVSFSYSTGSKTMALARRLVLPGSGELSGLVWSPPVCEYAALNAALHNIEKKKNISYRYSTGSQSDDAF